MILLIDLMEMKKITFFLYYKWGVMDEVYFNLYNKNVV